MITLRHGPQYLARRQSQNPSAPINHHPADGPTGRVALGSRGCCGRHQASQAGAAAIHPSGPGSKLMPPAGLDVMSACGALRKCERQKRKPCWGGGLLLAHPRAPFGRGRANDTLIDEMISRTSAMGALCSPHKTSLVFALPAHTRARED